jgi:hypothetical protein
LFLLKLSFKVCLFNMCSSHVPQAVKRAELFGIQGVTYSLTQVLLHSVKLISGLVSFVLSAHS